MAIRQLRGPWVTCQMCDGTGESHWPGEHNVLPCEPCGGEGRVRIPEWDRLATVMGFRIRAGEVFELCPRCARGAGVAVIDRPSWLAGRVLECTGCGREF